MSRRICHLTSISLCALSAAHTLLMPSYAQSFNRQVSTPTQLRLQVAPSCEFFSQSHASADASMHFGEHAVLNAIIHGQTAADTSIRLRCSPATSYQITINQGQNGSDVFSRRMASAATNGFINYQLFSDSSRTQVWDDNTGVTGQGTGDLQQYSVYGVIPVQPTPAAGLYQDQLVVTVSW